MVSAIFVWNPRYETGWPIIDQQHQHLVELLNELGQLYADDGASDQLLRVFDELANYAVYHFDTEENLMNVMALASPHDKAHRAAHGDFVKAVGAARQQVVDDPRKAMGTLLSFLTHWLVEHILGTDRRMVAEVLALQAGHSPAEAAAIADEKAADVTTVLLAAMRSLYDDLAARTDDLQKSNHLLQKEIEEKRCAEAKLARHHEQLEELVSARTKDLALARDEAEGANRAKSAFLANMSHELRTPLNHILGFASLLLHDQLGEKAKGRVEGIEHASRHLLALISDVLDMAKIEAEQIQINVINLDLTRVLDQAIRIANRNAEKKGLPLRCDVAPELPTHFLGDPVRISQILTHLLDNAIKFSEQGSIVLRVTGTPLTQTSCSLRFEVIDQGLGIAPAHQPALFRLFHQGDNSMSRRFGGTGLGLALSRRLVHLMLGEIGFTSVAGQGSTFWFSLPLALAPDDQSVIGPDAIDWVRVSNAIHYLKALLEEGDLQAQVLWGKHPQLFAPVLKANMAAFAEAMEQFNFEQALAMLIEARANSPQLAMI